ncbi:hypothetical protein VIGAN_08140900 [Vigna angularis var. angularis]|uniref:Kinesin-like protein KIN-10A n=1 Tax=Vigna angularis var. angularis TaxID=157739 RepID=A0A0S3SPT5_PHAAN|nr:hypothetical protein VIGAN_08140900 [Vigna angularis var. angularis]
MAPTPSSKQNYPTQMKTPQSKHRLNFHGPKSALQMHPSPNPNCAANKEPPPEHPIEVVARIRDYPDRKDKPLSVLQTSSNLSSIRVRADFGYRDFTLDGVSVSEEEDLDVFYKKFVESRINGVKLGDKCTIMMYGPTGSGKSHTMFGCSKQAGIVYRSLRDILGDGDNADGDSRGDSREEHLGLGTFVQVTVLEIYNEEIYDLLSTNGGGGGGGFGFGWPKGGSASKVKLEVMGKKAKNATYISGNEAGKISKEIQKVEKRRIVKSTLCNDRSSRSHCMQVILDVPTVGGRLMLVDMAGSENIEQAGQIGFEAKMQTAKINQGNIALKRVVESIANGDSHVPFRDSKLTMLLQDSFEDDKSKILMILCASPDPKEIHKTISTLEYGAKAKCIVRGPHTPVKDEESSSAVILGSRIAAMDEFILKLQMENKQREKERNEAHKKLLKKEEEIAALRNKLNQAEGKGTPPSEEEINLKVNERTRLLRQELEKKLAECQRMTNEFVELERKRMEERILEQQEEVETLRRRLEEIELQLSCSKQGGNCEENESKDMESSGFMRRLLRVYKSEEDPGMVKSMDLDMDDQEPLGSEVNIVGGVMCRTDYNVKQDFSNLPCSNTLNGGKDDAHIFAPNFGQRVCLSTVYEEEGEGDEDKGGDEEVEKEVIEETKVCSVEKPSAEGSLAILNLSNTSPKKDDCCINVDDKDLGPSRLLRIQNIFTLCGNQRELSQHIGTPLPTKKRTGENFEFSPAKTIDKDSVFKISNKENFEPQNVLGN